MADETSDDGSDHGIGAVADELNDHLAAASDLFAARFGGISAQYRMKIAPDVEALVFTRRELRVSLAVQQGVENRTKKLLEASLRVRVEAAGLLDALWAECERVDRENKGATEEAVRAAVAFVRKHRGITTP